MKNALIAAFVAASLPALAGTPAKNPVTPPPAAPAPASISYDFVQAGWVHGFDDTFVGDSDGYAIGLSKTLVGNLYGFASFGQSFAEDNVTVSGIDITGESESLSVAFGVGYHVPVASTVDWVIELGAAYGEVDNTITASLGSLSASISADGDAWGAVGSTGFRIALAKWLELDLFYTALYSDDTEEDLTHAGSASLIFRELLAPKLDIVVSGGITEEAEAISAGLRYNF